MKVCVFQPPKGASARYRWPFGAHPVCLVSLVLVEVSSIKTSLGRQSCQRWPAYSLPSATCFDATPGSRSCENGSSAFQFVEVNGLHLASDPVQYARPNRAGCKSFPSRHFHKVVHLVCEFSGDNSMTLQLNRPTNLFFIISLVIAVIAALVALGVIPSVPIASVWIMGIGYAVLAFGCLFKGA